MKVSRQMPHCRGFRAGGERERDGTHLECFSGAVSRNGVLRTREDCSDHVSFIPSTAGEMVDSLTESTTAGAPQSQHASMCFSASPLAIPSRSSSQIGHSIIVAPAESRQARRWDVEVSSVRGRSHLGQKSM